MQRRLTRYTLAPPLLLPLAFLRYGRVRECERMLGEREVARTGKIGYGGAMHLSGRDLILQGGLFLLS